MGWIPPENTSFLLQAMTSYVQRQRLAFPVCLYCRLLDMDMNLNLVSVPAVSIWTAISASKDLDGVARVHEV
jgi:hypothetical protein